LSTSVTGRVLGDGGTGISGLPVRVRSEGELISSDLGEATTDGSGNYTVSIPEDPFAGEGLGPRKLGVYVYAAKGPRQLSYASYDDGTGPSVTANDVTLRQVDVQGWAVSLPGTTNALPIRAGNAVRLLVDDKLAWEHVAGSITNAKNSISIMQLDCDLPQAKADASQERPEIVLSFPSDFDPDLPGTLPGTTADRLERLLVDAASNGKQVRVMIPHPDFLTLNGIADFVILVVPMLVGALFAFRPAWTFWSGIFQHIFGGGPKGDADAYTAYMKAANSSTQVTKFTTRTFSVVHAKTVLIDAVADAIDNAEAIVLGSPFQASYWDTGNHPVYEPRRGSCAGEPIPVHDVSLGLRGPIVADLQQQFLVHWNLDCAPGNQVVALDPPPSAATAASDEYSASVQLVRTVNDSTLPGLDSGEEGVLEAYLRAIENATEYIYFENQYFTNDTIAKALVAALKDTSRPNLQVILMVNVIPDMPFYPTWQTNLFERIRRDAGTDGASRFGVFTAWSHSEAAPDHKHNNPIIMPDYLHTKTAVVDGLWATVGSANLDGASLDQFQIMRALQFGNFRNDELNALIFNGIEGCPATDAVDQLRLQLWSEHLGIDMTDSRLSKDTLSASHGWLKLWTDTATANLQALINDPALVDPSGGNVLAYPPGAQSGFGLLWGWSHPHQNFLQSSQIGGKSIDLSKIDLVEQTTSFNYQTGKWADQ
jgi:phosphatidylserine/phosphatidylglycerophosphate/cardiolipin synthase-like enzyme